MTSFWGRGRAPTLQGGRQAPPHEAIAAHRWGRVSRRKLLQGASALGLSAVATSGFHPAIAGSVDIQGQTIRFINYTNWIGEGEYDKFKVATGAEVREIPINQGRSERVVADPSSADMILDPLGPLGLVDAAGLLAKLDLANIPNYALVHDSFKQGLAAAEQSKAVPIDYGRTGILYRTDLVSGTMDSWSDFWKAVPQQTRKVILPDSPNHTLRNALLMLGFDGSSREPSQIDRAANAIIEIKPHVAAFSTPDAVKRLLEGSAVLVMAEEWQGSSALRENPNAGLRWVDPAEGAAGYLDCIGAIQGTKVQPAIEQFLNFHLEPENSANFCNTLSTAPIVPASEKYVNDAIRNDPILNPSDEVLSRLSYWSYLGEAQRLWDDAWTRVKSA